MGSKMESTEKYFEYFESDTWAEIINAMASNIDHVVPIDEDSNVVEVDVVKLLESLNDRVDWCNDDVKEELDKFTEQVIKPSGVALGDVEQKERAKMMFGLMDSFNSYVYSLLNDGMTLGHHTADTFNNVAFVVDPGFAGKALTGKLTYSFSGGA